jgi:acyl-CoA thioester hydrolase
MTSHETEIRVRYAETDAMGYLHHSNYLTYFEIGRTELFRAGGGSYKAVEERGLFLVVVKIEVRYKKPARYDDLLTLRTTISRITPARIEHEYQLMRDGEVLTTGTSTLACVDGTGTISALPDELLESSG